MKREELEHIIRASGDITDQYEFVIIGSQSILGPVPNPPDAFTVSMEVDIYPLRFPELADEIEGASAVVSAGAIHAHQQRGAARATRDDSPLGEVPTRCWSRHSDRLNILVN